MSLTLKNYWTISSLKMSSTNTFQFLQAKTLSSINKQSLTWTLGSLWILTLRLYLKSMILLQRLTLKVYLRTLKIPTAQQANILTLIILQGLFLTVCVHLLEFPMFKRLLLRHAKRTLALNLVTAPQYQSCSSISIPKRNLTTLSLSDISSRLFKSWRLIILKQQFPWLMERMCMNSWRNSNNSLDNL